jgi:phosphoglycerate dehydrogenase-like enzyme
MSEFTVVFVDPKAEEELEWIATLEPAGSLTVKAPAVDSHESLEELLRSANAIVTQRRCVDETLIAAAPRLELIQRYGTRPDGIDLDAARKAGVQVATMPLRGCIAVAELAITLILALSKNLIEAHRATIEGTYRELGVEPMKTSQRRHNFQWMNLGGLLEVYGRKLGIIGFGEIGTETARRARALGMEVLYNKRTRLSPDAESTEGVRYATKNEILREADFVHLSTPLTPETENLIGARELALMQPTAFLVNTCRGGVIDEDALVEALKSETIAGAGLDVFVYEPIPHDHPLLECENVILTPHIGGGTGGARVKQMVDVLENVAAFARGQDPAHRVA